MCYVSVSIYLCIFVSVYLYRYLQLCLCQFEVRFNEMQRCCLSLSFSVRRHWDTHMHKIVFHIKQIFNIICITLVNYLSESQDMYAALFST